MAEIKSDAFREADLRREVLGLFDRAAEDLTLALTRIGDAKARLDSPTRLGVLAAVDLACELSASACSWLSDAKDRVR